MGGEVFHFAFRAPAKTLIVPVRHARAQSPMDFVLFPDKNITKAQPVEMEEPVVVPVQQCDVAVIGAGPVGCTTALAFAQQGARVLLLDAHPHAAHRLAGEWLHPPGVAVLRQLGIWPLAAAEQHTGRGFIVFPEDGSEPITLHYPDDCQALTCDHFLLVSALRETAAFHPLITYLPRTRATHITGQRLHYVAEGQATASRTFERIVGADGRGSLARRALGLADARVTMSSMAGVLLEDADMPGEGFGHVILGGPGPILAYRIGPRQVRVILDVPLGNGEVKKQAPALAAAYAPVLPAELRPAFERALRERPIAWAVNQWRSRVHYGREGLALVGDAVGHFHPLTAVGMTLGFLDAACLARSDSCAAYRRQRAARSGVAELLALGLYRVFTRQDDGTVALRQAVYRMWRQSPAECRRTMRLLSGDDTDARHFNQAFLKALTLAGRQLLRDTVLLRGWRRTARTLCGFGEWLYWLSEGNTAARARDLVAVGR